MVLTIALHLPQKGKLRLYGEWEVRGCAQRKRDLQLLDFRVHTAGLLGTQGPSRSWAGFLGLLRADEDTRAAKGVALGFKAETMLG